MPTIIIISKKSVTYLANRKLQFLVSGSCKQLSNEKQSHCKEINWLSINNIDYSPPPPYVILSSGKLNNC